MSEREKAFNLIASITGSWLTFCLGGWDMCTMVLAGMMCLDYSTGFMCGWKEKQLSSRVGFEGLRKKATILTIVIMAVLLDRLINDGVWVFRTLVCYFFIANEGISILENASRIGVPVPEKLMDALEQLKEKGE